MVNLERLERLVLYSPLLQRMLLRTHRRALRRLLPEIRGVRTVKIVGGGLFPRTAILLRELLQAADITIVDASRENLEICKAFLEGGVRFAHEFFETAQEDAADLVVIPLCFIGDRDSLYRNPPARILLIHDWLWSKRARSVVVAPFLLKRLNLVRRNPSDGDAEWSNNAN